MDQESSEPDKLAFPSLLRQVSEVTAKAQMSSITHLQLGTSSNYYNISPDIPRKKKTSPFSLEPFNLYQ